MKKSTLLLITLLCSLVLVAQIPGEVTQLTMPCRLLQGINERAYSIYLPASYKPEGLRHYPVLYLMHGGGESHTVWQRNGHLQQVADSLIRIACRKYKDVYWVDCTNASVKSHDTSVDGIHPTNYGYTLWAESVRKPITRILKKYGIR